MKSRDVSAVVVAYGKPVLEAEALRSIPCPILALYGDYDEITMPQHIEAFRSALAAARRTAEVKIYPNTGHGFMDEADSRYKAVPAQDAWDKMFAFLKSNL
jgi:carboxymethylenebutenolidase